MIRVQDKNGSLYEFVAVCRKQGRFPTGKILDRDGVPEEEHLLGYAIVGTLPCGERIELHTFFGGEDDGKSASLQCSNALKVRCEEGGYKFFSFQ